MFVKSGPRKLDYKIQSKRGTIGCGNRPKSYYFEILQALEF